MRKVAILFLCCFGSPAASFQVSFSSSRRSPLPFRMIETESTEESNDSSTSSPFFISESGSSNFVLNTTSTTTIRREDSSLPSVLATDSTTTTTMTTTSTASFGDVVVRRRRPTSTEKEATVSKLTPQDDDDAATLASQMRRRNFGVAMASVAVAVFNYVWQFTHPISPVQLLVGMQENSVPVSVIGVNGKPTVVDFWAPWCENCKLMAPTLYQVEEEYKDRVNFVMVDGDKRESWPLIEAFGVDAIPHMALVSSEGEVETALIGPIPKRILEADLDVLIANAKRQGDAQPEPIPHYMLDVFEGNPQGRKVHFNP